MKGIIFSTSWYFDALQIKIQIEIHTFDLYFVYLKERERMED